MMVNLGRFCGNVVMTTSPVIVKLGAHIGARVEGVRLGGDLPSSTVAAINHALLTHKAIFFRDQHHLDDAEQLAFAATLGTPTLAHPTVLSRGTDVLPIDQLLGACARGDRADALRLAAAQPSWASALTKEDHKELAKHIKGRHAGADDR